MRNMRVLATDQRTDSKDEEGKTEVKAFSNVTLEATPKISEKIAVAQTMGQLSLSLRSTHTPPKKARCSIRSGRRRFFNAALAIPFMNMLRFHLRGA